MTFGKTYIFGRWSSWSGQLIDIYSFVYFYTNVMLSYGGKINDHCLWHFYIPLLVFLKVNIFERYKQTTCLPNFSHVCRTIRWTTFFVSGSDRQFRLFRNQTKTVCTNSGLVPVPWFICWCAVLLDLSRVSHIGNGFRFLDNPLDKTDKCFSALYKLLSHYGWTRFRTNVLTT